MKNSDIGAQDPLDGVNEDRRRFLRTVLAGSAVAVPVVMSMALAGNAMSAVGVDASGAPTDPTQPSGPTRSDTTAPPTTPTRPTRPTQPPNPTEAN